MMQHRDDLKEAMTDLEIETFLDREGIDYKVTHGSSGSQLNIRECPVCGNRSWKVFLNEDNGLGNCFAGSHPPGENFNKWSFIEASLGFSKRDTAQYIIGLSKEMGWMPARDKGRAVNEDHTELKLPASIPLPNEGKHLSYLARRGITPETAEYLHLRYSAKGWFVYQVDGEERYMSFAKRVLIPVYDLDGNLVSFQGRDITGEADRKYLFPPGFASTGKYLFNGHNALGAKEIVVGEGAFDVAAIRQALDTEKSLRHVVPVGTFGKHLSFMDNENGQDQFGAFIRLKGEGLKAVTLMWDSEASAIKAMTVAAQKLMSIGLAVRVAILPHGKDPNECSPQEVIAAFLQSTAMTKLGMAKLRLLAK